MTKKNHTSITSSSVRSGAGYKFINPLLECEVGDEGSIKKYIPFEEEIKSTIRSEIIDLHPDKHISVYFRNLNNGPWFGMNEDERFAPASLLKVPLMMAYLKWEEDKEGLLSSSVEIGSLGNGPKQYFPPETGLEVGKKYSISDLVEHMIVYSDNTARQILFDNIPVDRRSKSFTEIGIKNPEGTNQEGFMSVKDYASFFRILYNAAYLNNESSEQALAYLSKTTFSHGIRKGVPEKIGLAHKFGERMNLVDGKEQKQLHDCGIIYYPQYPYLLCIMSRGDDFESLSSVIGKISEIVYQKISETYPE